MNRNHEVIGVSDAPTNGMGNRKGPRFTVGADYRVSCQWEACKHGVVIWDNWSGSALGCAFAVVGNESIAVNLVNFLNHHYGEIELINTLIDF